MKRSLKKSLSTLEIEALQATHSPQCTKGAVPARLLVGLCPNGDFVFWDSAQTAGYICSTPDPEVCRFLLWMEQSQRGSVRALATGKEVFHNLAPPEPHQETYTPLDLDLEDLVL